MIDVDIDPFEGLIGGSTWEPKEEETLFGGEGKTQSARLKIDIC